MFSRFDRIPAYVTDGRTDRQTSCHSIVRAMHTRRAVKWMFVSSTTSQVATFLQVNVTSLRLCREPIAEVKNAL